MIAQTADSPPDKHAPPRPIAPRSPVEAEIAAMAATLMGLPSLGVEDNLLDLGGASLELGQLIVRIRQHYGVDVRLDSFFRTPTVAYLAGLVEQRREKPNAG